jgi:mRNA interferase MazF
MADYVPRKGELIALTFDPQSGHEQQGRRPALVVSNDLFNKHTGLCIVCPITNTRRAYPFHVAVQSVQSGVGVTGYVMVEQVKSIDFRSRKAKRLGIAPAAMLQEVLSLLDACIY